MKKIIYSSSIVMVLTISLLLEVSAGSNAEKDSRIDNNQNHYYSKKRLWTQYPVAEDSLPILSAEIVGKYAKKIKKEALLNAQTLADIIPYYPSNWISEYDEVEILTTGKGLGLKAYSAKDLLNTLQKNIMAESDFGTTMYINVRYKYQNPMTQILEENEIHVNMLVVPFVEAAFAEGDEKMKQYIQENITEPIVKSTPKQNHKGEVAFTVNHKGEIVNAKVTKSSDNLKADKLMLDAIHKMPNWKPAENSKGLKVNQRFTLRIGNFQDGC
jgi:hypothetical protein